MLQKKSFDIERFIAGAEKIDRKREVIERIIRAVIQKLPHNKESYEGLSFLGTSLGLPNNGKMLYLILPHAGRFAIFQVIIGEQSFPTQRKPGDILLYEMTKDFGQNTWECPLSFVQNVYDALPEFVAQVARLIPAAEIKEYFESITAYAHIES